MEVTPVNRIPALPVETPVVPADRAAENRELVHAVKAVNAAEMFGRDNELRFRRDERTQRMLVQVVNSETHEVISQVPPEYVLRLAEDLKSR